MNCEHNLKEKNYFLFTCFISLNFFFTVKHGGEPLCFGDVLLLNADFTKFRGQWILFTIKSRPRTLFCQPQHLRLVMDGSSNMQKKH